MIVALVEVKKLATEPEDCIPKPKDGMAEVEDCVTAPCDGVAKPEELQVDVESSSEPLEVPCGAVVEDFRPEL